MSPRYRVTLMPDEREMLEALSTTGVRPAKTVLHARALLLLDAGERGPKWKVADAAEALGMTPRTLEHLKARFVEQGLEEALQRKERERPPRPVVFDGEFEARLIQLACSKAPAGRSRWTIRLLAEKLVELRIVPTVSNMTVCNTLKKTGLYEFLWVNDVAIHQNALKEMRLCVLRVSLASVLDLMDDNTLRLIALEA